MMHANSPHILWEVLYTTTMAYTTVIVHKIIQNTWLLSRYLWRVGTRITFFHKNTNIMLIQLLIYLDDSFKIEGLVVQTADEPLLGNGH